eukprot:SAG22_NODE_1581_length_4066_cov_1.922107_3_plen_456_part_00
MDGGSKSGDPSPQQPQHQQPAAAAAGRGSRVAQYVLDFAALPRAVFIIFAVEFLNSYRGYGINYIQYQYVNNEFGPSDLETGSLLGVKSTMDIVFGICGSLATDAFGVRQVSMAALAMALVGRGLLVFGRGPVALWAACLFFSPFGEAVLSTGIYNVALKKLTPPRLRPLAFAVQYASFNFSGALCDVAIEYMRAQPDRYILGARFTGLRCFLASTWLVLWVALAVVYFCVHDVTVVDPTDPERDDGVALPTHDIDGRPLSEPPVPAVAERPPAAAAGTFTAGGRVGRMLAWRRQATARYRLVRTPLQSDNIGGALRAHAADVGWLQAGAAGVAKLSSSMAEVARLPQLWRVIGFSLMTFFVGKQWGDMSTMMIPFLIRYFGENVPAYTIHSVNLWGCLLLPPAVAAATGGHEAFAVILPGMWIMAFAPAWLAASPTAVGAVLWLVQLTIGEVAW